MEADRGGSSVIRRHEDALLLVEAGERELFDCDTKQALEILKGNAERRSSRRGRDEHGEIVDVGCRWGRCG